MVLMMVLVLHGMHLASLPPGVPVSSVRHCASRCYRQRNCSSIVYDGSTKQCHLSTEVCLKRELTSKPNDMQYFVWRRDDCNKGYKWYRSLRLCYKIYTSTGNWFQANHTCHRDGGHLIKVNSAGINALMNKISDAHSASIWLGGFEDDRRGSWTWTDGSVMSQDYWGDGQPDNEAEKCLGIWTGFANSMRRLNDFACEYPDVPLFVCQLPLKKEIYC